MPAYDGFRTFTGNGLNDYQNLVFDALRDICADPKRANSRPRYATAETRPDGYDSGVESILSRLEK